MRNDTALRDLLGMERMPRGQFEANAVFFRIGILAYNLFRMFELIRRRIRAYTMA